MNASHVHDLPRPLKAFLLTKFLAYAQFAFAQFLINIYFWRITQDIPFLVLFNTVFFTAHALTYIPAGKIAKEYNRFLPLRIGMVLQLAYLLLILFLKEDVARFIVPVALIGGISHGAYWLSDNLLKFDLTEPENRLKAGAGYEIMHSIANSILPLFASILVAADGGVFHAYSRIFVLAILFAALVFASSFFISKDKIFYRTKLRFFSASKELLMDRNTRIACIGNALFYVSRMMPVLLGLLLFVGSGSELSIGKYQFVTILIVVATNFAMGRYLSRKNYRLMLIWGGITGLLLTSILVVSQSYLAIFTYGILSSLTAFLSAPFYPLLLDAFDMHCKNRMELIDKRVEYIMLMEFFVLLGSLVSLATLLLLHSFLDSRAIGAVVMIFAVTGLAGNVLLVKIKEA